MDAQQLEYQLPERIEQALSSAGMMYFTYNRGIAVNDASVTAQIELKGSKHAFKLKFVYDRAAQTALVTIEETEGEPPAGNADKVCQALTALPPDLKAIFE